MWAHRPPPCPPPHRSPFPGAGAPPPFTPGRAVAMADNTRGARRPQASHPKAPRPTTAGHRNVGQAQTHPWEADTGRTQEGPKVGQPTHPAGRADGRVPDTGSAPLSLPSRLGKRGPREEKPSPWPSPSAQHDDAPGLGVDSAVVAVHPDTCRGAEGLGHPRGTGS